MTCCNSDFVSAVIVAGGKGERLGAAQRKQYVKLGKMSILGHTLSTFATVAEIDEVVVVVPESDVEFVSAELLPAELGQLARHKPILVAAGGASRQESVRAGLDAMNPRAMIALVHDAARPFVTPTQIRQVIDSARTCGGAILAVPVNDTLKLCEYGFVARTAPRERLFAAQTPQAFDAAKLRRAHERAAANGTYATDDAGLFEELGYDVAIVEGENLNIKITTEDDLRLARLIATGLR